MFKLTQKIQLVRLVLGQLLSHQEYPEVLVVVVHAETVFRIGAVPHLYRRREQRWPRLKQDERRLSLETEIAMSQAREQALATVIDPKPWVFPPGPLYSDPRLADTNQIKVNPNPQSVAVESRPRAVAPNSVMSQIRARGVPSLPVPQVHST